MKASHLLMILANVFVLAQAHGAIDTSKNWQRLETEHFELLFDAQHRQVATKYAEAAERAHTLLAPIFNYQTPERTVLVLDDSTDVANGFATPIPRQLITIFPVLPNGIDFLSHYGNWAHEIVTHEYTHTLTFEPAEGLWKPLRFVFGSVIRPNGLLPRWYTEGVAVQNESKFTTMGRLRSPLYRAIIRSQVIDDVWGQEGLDRANDLTNPSWPRGSRPYFLGALIWNRLVEKKDDAIQGELNRRYASRIPYLLHQPMEDNFGQDFNQFLQTTYSEFSLLAKNQLQVLSAQPSTDQDRGAFPIEGGYLQHTPRISPDGMKLVLTHQSFDNSIQILVSQRPTTSEPFPEATSVLLQDLESTSRVSWFPDSSKILYDAVGSYKRFNDFSDLFELDVKSKKSHRLTTGQRLREGTVSPDGSQIVAVKLGASQTWIVGMNKDGENQQILYSPDLLVRVSTPEFLSADEIIFSERGINGVESLRYLHLKTKELKTVLSRLEPIQFAHKTSEGVVFQSIRNGTGNLFLANADLTDAAPLTHTKTHIFNGTLDTTTKQVLVSRLTASGGRLETLPLQPRKDPLPGVGLNDGYQFASFFEPETTNQEQAESRPYSAGRYLWPQYWLPIVLSGPYGSQFGGSIFGSDPLNFHNYAAGGFYDTLSGKPGFLLSYSNRQTPVILSFSAQDSTNYVESLRLNNQQTFITGKGSFFLPALSNDWRGLAGWTFYQTQYEGYPVSTQQGPFIGVAFDNTSMKGYQISPQTGWTGDLSHTEYLPGLGSDNYRRTSANLAKYVSLFLPKNHALKLSTSGTYSAANRELLVGAASAGGEYIYGSLNSPLIVRGYAPGSFLGWSILTTSMEYRLPISYPYQGSGTAPWFLRRVHGAVFWDSLTTEGAYSDSNTRKLTRSYFGNFYSGVGAEIRFDLTVAYMAPLTARIGYHYGLREYAGGGGGIYIGFVLPKF